MHVIDVVGARSPARNRARGPDALANATNDPRTHTPYLGFAEGIAELVALHDPTIWQRPGSRIAVRRDPEESYSVNRFLNRTARGM